MGSVIKDKLPWETTTDEVLQYNTENLQTFLKQELELERDKLLERVFQKTLEQIFIGNRLYKKIEDVKSYEIVHTTIETSLKPFHKDLERIPTNDDREKLLSIPIRRISRFDLDKNKGDIQACLNQLEQVEKNLRNLKRFVIRYLRRLIENYGSEHRRRTKIKSIEQVDVRKVATKQVKVGFDATKGFLGTKISAETSIECTNFDKLVIIFKDGTYKVINIPEKEYIAQDRNPLVFVGVADKKTVMSIVYKDDNTGQPYAKRFVVEKFILDKQYHYLKDGQSLQFITSEPSTTVHVSFKPKPKQKVKNTQFNLDNVAIKGVNAKGIRISNKEMKAVKITKTRSTK